MIKTVLFILLVATATLSAQNYVAVTHTLPNKASIADIAVDSENNIILATDNGIMILTANGEWHMFTTTEGLPDNTVLDVETSGTTIIVSTLNKGLGYIQDGKWYDIVLDTGEEYSYVSAMLIRATDSLYGTDNGKLFYVAGKSIRQVQFPEPIGKVADCHFIKAGANPDFLECATLNGLALYVPAFGQGIVGKTSSTPIPSNHVLAGTANATALAYYGTDNGIYITDASDFPTGKIRASILNTGNSPLPSNRIQAVDAREDTQWYGTDKGLVRISGTLMAVFTTDNTSGMPSDDIVELALDNNDHIWFATTEGDLATITTTSAVPEAGDTQAGLAIEGLYPNPSSGKLFITFNSDGRQRIHLGLCDMVGREVAVITDGVLEEGRHIVEYDAGDIPSALYYIKLSNGEENVTYPVHILR